MTAAENESLQKDIRRALIRRIMIYIGVILVIIIAFTFAFRQFKIYSDARLALREAKNIKMSLEMINTEYYAIGISIYDDTAEGNIRKGACDYVKKIQGELKGEMKLTGYDSANRIITGIEYETENYIVRYSKNGKEETWRVSLIKELLSY
jgi:hypothetical protein